MIVILEGLDNCGKTTLIEMIHEYYESIDIKSQISKEFETNIGKELKKMARSGDLDSVLKSYLFAADRYIRIKKLSEEEKKLLLFDRYVPSAIAYRMAEGIDKEWISTINSVFSKADIGFFIDISPIESVKRNTDAKFNIKSSPEHLSHVRDAYLSILSEQNLVYIDGMRPIEIIFDEIITKLEEFRKKNEKRI